MQRRQQTIQKKWVLVLFATMVLCIAFCVSGCGNSQTADATQKDTQVSKEAGADAIPKEGTIDLTKMDKSLMYAVITQMAEEPARYEGRDIVMEGTYQQAQDGEDGDVFHYCIVQDDEGSMNGLEFVLKDKNSYPDSVEQICVSGTFETYREKGSDTTYCRIKDAVLKTVK